MSVAMERPAENSTEAPRVNDEEIFKLETLGTYKPRIKSLDTSPSTGAGMIGELDDEDPSDSEYELEQSNGLEPTAIFQNFAKADTKRLAPEQNITLFALRLALIEKSASGIGTLSFIWATTIIMGGYAANINPVDFTVITLILVTEGTRIFSRSKELEWQHLASKSTDSSLTYRTAQAVMNLGKSYNSDLNNGKAAKEPTLSGVLHPESARKATFRDHTASSRDDQESDIGYRSHQNFQSIPYLQSMETFAHKPDQTAWRSSARSTDDMTRQNSIDSMVTVFRGRYTSVLSTRGVTSALYWVQTFSAIICLALSCWRLLIQKYDPPAVLAKQTPANLYMSLNIFYILAVTQALLFLMKRIYWEYKINSDQLMVQVNGKPCELGKENQETIKHFFYEVYRKCIDGSVFDGLAMDIVAYSLTLLQSDSSSEQLGGLRMLREIVDRDDGCSMDALRRIGTTPGMLERFVEMLSWSSTHQKPIRREAAALISKGIRYSQNCFRIAAVPGSMDCIVSLLRPHERSRLTSVNSLIDSPTSDSSTSLRLVGLGILLAYARDPVNLLKVGDTLGLVPILISFIRVRDVHRFKEMEGAELETFDKALRLLTMLATARNTSGTILRPVIVRLVSGITSLRDILEFGHCHPKLQSMAIEILTNLTLEYEIRRPIGSTGGIIRNLVALYTRNLDAWSGPFFATGRVKKEEEALSTMAGDALDLLAIMNRENCMLMMDLQGGNGMRTFIPALLSLLNDYREQTICAAKILRSLLEYGSYSQKREIAVCIVRVMRLVMESSSPKMHEAVVGLSSRILNVLDEPTYNQAFENMDRTELVQKLLTNLEYNARASSKFPRIRRHSIELILALVKKDPNFLEEFIKDGLLERKLQQTLDTVCEAEDFAIFSGAEGLMKHSITMENLVQRSILELRSLVREREEIACGTLELTLPQYP